MEIGSEFWNEFKDNTINKNLKIPQWLYFGQDRELLLSGRTAIDFIIKDIKYRSKVKLAYLPSYCCFSMVKPFLDNNINVDFYGVKYSKKSGFEYDIDGNKNTDIFLAMNYYGFTKSEMSSYIKAFKNRNKIVIEDITHSLFNSGMSNGDYEIASIRKWLAIPSGGMAVKYNNDFIKFGIKLKQNNKYIDSKLTAMRLKAEYIKSGDKKLKTVFLDEFNRSNNLLANEYREFSIDNISISILSNIDIRDLIRKRKENVKFIYDNLKETNDMRFVYPYDPNVCPIFVPIRINKNRRDILRKYFIDNEIYSPIHWNYYPNGFESKDLEEINQTILSLVCDQRYGKKEMEYMINKINDFMLV